MTRTVSYLALILVLLVLANACSDPLPASGVMPNAIHPQVTPTYDGSGEVNEPTLEYFPSGWNGFKYWLLVSPYPSFNQDLENPSILVSQDGNSWVVPPGLTNPLALPSNPADPLHDHLDDATILYDQASGQLWLYYIESDDAAEILKRMVSSDGIHWSAAQQLFSDRIYHFISPSIQRTGDHYIMWSVDSGIGGCSATSTRVVYRTSLDGINWSKPQPTDLAQLFFKIWHINVKWIPQQGEFWAIYSGFQSNCGYDNLFFARSADGIHWSTFAPPLVSANRHNLWDGAAIYRGTGFLDPTTGDIRIWYAGRRGLEWRLGYTHENLGKVMNGLLQR